jgi:predicted transcriptional regulator YdeE
MKGGGSTMEPKILQSCQFTLVGMSFYGDPFSNASSWCEENEIGSLWHRFMQLITQNPDAIKERRCKDQLMEIHFETDESAEKGYFEVFVGATVNRLVDVPLSCVVKILPPTEYAIFTLVGEAITSDWAMAIDTDWFSQSGYEISHPYNIQLYDDRFKGFENMVESALDVYIPIRQIGQGDSYETLA